MDKTIIISGHPNPERSFANTSILSHLEDTEGVEIRQLITLYTDYNIDSEKEIRILTEAKHIILQFPFHWYGVPPILKMWIDSVTTPLVYGQHKGALKNKTLIISTTTGGPAESYASTGYNKHSMKEFLLPVIKLGDSLGMHVPDPVITHSAAVKGGDLEERLRAHAHRLIKMINTTHEGILERQV